MLVFMFSYFTSFCHYNDLAKMGVLDLRSWNWEKNGITDLNGEWEFYWNALYTPAELDSLQINPITYGMVPGFWNSLIPGKRLFSPGIGYGTYRLKILCPASGDKLSLKFLTIGSEYKLFVNGKQIWQEGNVGTSKASSEPAFIPVILPVDPLNNELNIVIQVSNFTYNEGGLWDFIKLGARDQIQSYWLKSVSWDFFIAGSFFLMGIFYFVIYFFSRRRLSPLYFSIFCILLAIRPLITGDLPINLVTHWSWHFIKRMEFVSLFLTVPVMSLFSFELFPKEFSKKILRIILLISLPFVLIALFTAPFIFRYFLRPFEVFMLLTACYGLYTYINAVKKRRPGSGYFLFGFIILFVTFINDLLYTSLVIESVSLVYVGLFIFIISQAVTVSRQFFWTFSRLEIVNNQLENINLELQEKNKTISETNLELTRLNAELDSIVYRTSHDLRSPVTSILTLVEIIKQEKEAAKRNAYLDMQTKTLFRLDSLITDTLDFARNKRMDLNYEEVDFNELIQNALQDHIFAEDSHYIKKVIEIDQKVKFVTDRTRLKIVINNLISNALRYHNREQGNPYLKILVQVTVSKAEIQVIDNGQGIEENHLNHIFTMFYRANKAISGSGLGLYIVKEAIEKMGGTITVESQIHAGTKFFIVIPNHNGD